MLKKLLSSMALACVIAAPITAYATEKEPTWKVFDRVNDATPHVVVEAMLKLANVGPDDTVYDLGCGDGRIVITAAKRYGTRGWCVDINPKMIVEARANAEMNGVTDKITFIHGDIFEVDLDWKGKPNIKVFLFLWHTVNARLRPILLDELLAGTVVISHQHRMWNEDDKRDVEWFPDETKIINTRTKHWGRTSIYKWIVPAKIDGSWRLSVDEDLVDITFKQKYQRFSGSASVNGRLQLIRHGRINGANVAFDMVTNGKPRRYIGQVQPRGEVEGDSWRAARN